MKAVKWFAPLLIGTILVGCHQPTPQNNTETTASSAPTQQEATATDVNPVKARIQIMKDWGKAMKTMGGMVKEPNSFNAETFKTEAQKLTADPWQHFADGTKGGEAKEEIWTQADDFKAEIEKFTTAVQALTTATQSASSLDNVKAQFADVGASCKSCHDKYKKD